MSFQSISHEQIPDQIKTSNYADRQQVKNPKTGKIERVFVNLEAVYPNPDNPLEEMSFEELRALSRGWLHKDWTAESEQSSAAALQVATSEQSSPLAIDKPADALQADGSKQNQESQNSLEEFSGTSIVEDVTRGGRNGRPRKTKIMEVKVETQTSKNLREIVDCTD